MPRLILFIFSIFLTLFFGNFCFGQAVGKSFKMLPAQHTQAVKSSAAYAEVLLRKAELEADVESLLESYTEDYPKIKESRYELSLIQKDFDRLLKEPDATKLSLPLGKLIVRKNQLETDLWALQNQYGSEHPQVKRARRKAEIFRKAVEEILP